MLRERYRIFRRASWRYATALVISIIAFALRMAFEPVLHGRSPFITFVLAVALSAIVVGARPALLTAFAGLALGFFFFLEPKHEFFPMQSADLVQGIIYLLSSLLIVATAELTERERAKTRRVRDRFQLLTEQAQEYAVITSDANGIIESWSRGAEQLFGFSADEARGRHIALIFTEEDRKNNAPESEIETALRTGHALDERWHVRRDGSRFFGLGILVPLRDEDGRILEFAKILRDGTHLKRREEQLTKRAQQSESALVETTEHIDAFTYTVAHDLRAPLRALDGYAKALRDDFEKQLPDEAREHISKILAAAHRMDELVNDLLEFWRLTRRREARVIVNADAILDHVLADLSREIKSKDAIIERRPLPAVHGHADCLYKAFCHLVTNALKFSEPDRTPRVEIGAENRDGNVRLYVKDNGPGIAPEYHGKIYRVFERLHKDKPGTGIGLSIVHKCAELMGGRTGVDSKPGNGSCFWLELRRAEHGTK